MKKHISLSFLTLFMTLAGHAEMIDSIHHESLEKIMLCHPDARPKSVVLFVSGGGGWEAVVGDMTKTLAGQGALVLGIDTRTYRESLVRQASGCLYPAADFEQLSMMIQKKRHFPDYLKPILVGYSYGATLIYAFFPRLLPTRS